MEEIPGAVAEAQELFLLLALRLGAVTAGSKGPTTSGVGAVSKRRAASLVIGAPALATTRAAVAGAGAEGGRRRGRLVSGVVHNLGEQLRAATSHVLLSLFGRSVSCRVRSRLAVGRMRAGRSRGSRMSRMSGVTMVVFGATQAGRRHRATVVVHRRLFWALRRAVRVVGGEDITNGGEARRVLRRGMRMRLMRVRGLVMRMMRVMRRRQGMTAVVILLTACEALAQRGRLNHTLVGKLLMRGSDDGKARRCALPTIHESRLFGRVLAAVPGVVLVRVRAEVLIDLLLVQTLNNDFALLLTNRHAALQLLLHDRVLRNESWREAGKANFFYAEAFATRHANGCGRSSSNVVPVGEIEPVRTGARGGHSR